MDTILARTILLGAEQPVRVLVVEDERELGRTLCEALEEEGFAVDLASDGRSGLRKAAQGNYDAIVLDWMLPQLDGLSLLRRLRDVKRTPVLILTARDATSDKVRGLNAGADDYLAKPFALEELLARVRSLVRRAANHPSPHVRLGDLCIDLAASRVLRQGVEVALTAKEYGLLELLVPHRGRLVTRRMIYDCLYDEWDETLSNTIEVYVASLRRKLGPEIIQTRRGQGYLIRD